MLTKVDNVLDDQIGYIGLLGWMGGQQEIVNRARKCYQSQEKSEPVADARLLKRLVGSKPLHGTTLRGTVFTFDVLAPQFVVRQWTRHIVGHDYWGNDVWYAGSDTLDIGGAYDEQSFRYTDEIRFYRPSRVVTKVWDEMCRAQVLFYRRLRDEGVPKELARCALGSQVYSQFEWTANLQAILDWLHKRLPGGGAQHETAKYALSVDQILYRYVPEVMEEFHQERLK